MPLPCDALRCLAMYEAEARAYGAGIASRAVYSGVSAPNRSWGNLFIIGIHYSVSSKFIKNIF
jgi:hypothetical protein